MIIKNFFRIFTTLFYLAVLAASVSGCQQPTRTPAAINGVETVKPAETTTSTALLQPEGSLTASATPAESAAPELIERFTLWYGNYLPEMLQSEISISENIEIVTDPASAQVILDFSDTPLAKNWLEAGAWVYVLTAPFPTIRDNMELETLKGVWQGKAEPAEDFPVILMDETTGAVFSRVWGEMQSDRFVLLQAGELLHSAWDSAHTWAIIPFEQLDPRWKVIRIDDVSPLDADFNPDQYPLRLLLGLENRRDIPDSSLEVIARSLQLPFLNRDPSKLTTLMMTGTTALVRYTALRMEENGVRYPARDVVDLLKSADFTHISNEVPFYQNCPPANPVRLEQRFCSDPSYFDLLDFIDADVIELTGNHILDWGETAFLSTLAMYEAHDVPYYGGGRDLNEARKPVIIDHKTQQLVLIGCSPAGPKSVWAGNEKPGSNPCDREWMSAQIDQANAVNALPIVTFQHLEVEDYVPHSSQRIDFLRAASMGAVIVSGSQSHFAQTMTFVGDHFVHYGLGNLFFDQMYGENPREFVDRHTFYDGRYISTELLTLMLEDSAKPRVMTGEERADFLNTIFERCNWETAFPEEVNE